MEEIMLCYIGFTNACNHNKLQHLGTRLGVGSSGSVLLACVFVLPGSKFGFSNRYFGLSFVCDGCGQCCWNSLGTTVDSEL